MRRPLRLSLLVAGVALASWSLAPACSLCPSGFQQTLTFREEAGQAFAKTILYGKVLESDLRPDGSGSCKYEILDVLRPDPVLGDKKELVLPRYVPVLDKKQPHYLLFCDVFNKKIDAYRGVLVQGDAVVAYLKKATALPNDPVARLRFYFEYLEHAEKEIATDAFLEFAKADDRYIGEAARAFPAEKVRGWLKSDKTPAERVGVYAFLLGVCGGPEDASVLRAMLADPSDRMRNAYDGILSGLLHQKPDEGWELVHAGLADGRTPLPLRLAMVRAVRVLYTWRPEPTKPKMLQAARTILGQGELADLAIEDLRRWKVWDLTGDVLGLWGKKGYTAPIMERAIVRYALTNKADAKSQAFVAERRKDKPDLVKEVEEGLEYEK